MTELKRCPFCGGEACIQEHVFVGKRRNAKDIVYMSIWGVVCQDCLCETNWENFSKEEVAEAWNRRAEHGIYD